MAEQCRAAVSPAPGEDLAKKLMELAGDFDAVTTERKAGQGNGAARAGRVLVPGS
jgi:hypothetical protein